MWVPSGNQKSTKNWGRVDSGKKLCLTSPKPTIDRPKITTTTAIVTQRKRIDAVVNSLIADGMPMELITEMQEARSVEPFWDIPFTSGSSFILLMSSLTMVLAHKAVHEGDYRNSRVWLAATALLGSTFIAGQVYEFTAFYREGLHYDGSLFGSAFFTLTGFHGVHVTGGIIMLMSLLVLSFRGKLRQDRAETVELVGLYWHFVDIVWVLIFTIVYLIP